MTAIEVTVKWDVFVAPGVPTEGRDMAPGETRNVWSPISSTLIYGEHDAVLVDPLMTTRQAEELCVWVARHHKRVTTIYATHGHGDHFFGATTILERFHTARFVATPGVIEIMRRQMTGRREAFWTSLLPGQIPAHPAIAESLEGRPIDLEGHALVPVEVGHTDTDNTTVLHAPDVGLVVAGDVVYNDVHVFLGESNHQTRHEWLDALDTVARLDPKAVIAGHKRPGTDDDPRIIGETQQYIRDFDRLAEATATARELYDQMLALYPDRVNRNALWLSVLGVKRT